MNKIFILLFIAAFIMGQFARFQLGQGVSLIALDIVVGFFISVWCVKKIIKRSTILSPLTTPLVLFFTTGLISLLVNLSLTNEETLISSLYLIRFLSYAGLYFVIREFSKDDKGFFMKGLITICIVTIVVGVIQYFYYPGLQNLYYLGWDDHLYRLFSVFLDPNFTGVLFVCFFLYLLYYFRQFSTFNALKKSLFLFIVCLNLIVIFLTYSRTALIMLVSGGVVYLLLQRNKKILVAFLIIVCSLFLITIDPHVEGLNPFRTVSTLARVNSYEIAVDIFSKHPFLGVGFNAYRYAQNEYGYRASGNWRDSHADAGTDNSFLFVLATTGVIGFFSYLWLWFRIIRSVLKRVKQKSYFAHVTICTIVALFIGSFFVNALFYPFIMAWIFSLIALTEST